ncbi:MAG: PD-(D/E)XK nuclease family protein [Methanobacteriaceae archaeon]|nr:PD-(D/E)XK nuclease family protein [Methanobacteriaceae archaeon]
MSMRLSKSKVNDFINCPRKFKYRYIDEIESKPNEFAILGTNVHKIAQDFIELNQIGTYDEILEILLKFEGEYEDDYTGHCENLAKFFYEMLVEKEYKCFIAEEYLFSKKHNFNGFADLVLEDSLGKLFVIDYKTGKSSSAKNYKLELCYYKMLIEEQYGKEVANAGIYFTKDGILSSLEFKNQKSNDNICSIEDYELSINFIRTVRLEIDSAKFPSKRGYLCNYCDYQELCNKEDGYFG